MTSESGNNDIIIGGYMPEIQRVCLAAEFGAAKKLTELIDAGADVDEADQVGKTALWIACRNGEYELARILMERGADINRSTESLGISIFLTACGSTDAHVEIVRMLLARGADVNQTDSKGCTPLMRAVLGTNVKLIKLLLQHGAAKDATYENGLIPAGTTAADLNRIRGGPMVEKSALASSRTRTHPRETARRRTPSAAPHTPDRVRLIATLLRCRIPAQLLRCLSSRLERCSRLELRSKENSRRAPRA